MMGKFTPQLKELPGGVDMGSPTPLSESRAAQLPSSARSEQPDHLRMAQTLLEREVARPEMTPADAETVREVLYGLRERNLHRVNLVYREAFRELRSPSDGVKRAWEHLDAHFKA